jgi:hypothetical protein
MIAVMAIYKGPMKKHLVVCLVVCLVALMAVGTISEAVQSQGSGSKILVGRAKIIDGRHIISSGLVPIAISGDNAYIAWWTNKTGNDEVQFRASTDGGTTFADKINLSNSTDTESQDVEIAAEGDNVVVTWWERNATANEPVLRISTDNGETFGPLLKLATNGTIGGAGGLVNPSLYFYSR